MEIRNNDEGVQKVSLPVPIYTLLALGLSEFY